MKQLLAILVFASLLAVAPRAAAACRVRMPAPDNSPNPALYRDMDAGLVIATVINGGRAEDARLRVDETIYGRFEGSPLLLGWPGDPQYSYVYGSDQVQEDGSIVIGGCGYRQDVPVVEAGQRVVGRLGITHGGAQVVVRWVMLDDARNDPAIAAYLDAPRPAERRCLGAALRPWPRAFGGLVPIVPNARDRPCRLPSRPAHPS